MECPKDPISSLMSMKTATPEAVQQKVKKALEEKEKGNDFFKKGDNSKAIYHYHSALMYLNGMNEGSNQKQEINQLKVVCNNNLAAVLLKKGGNPEKIVKYCSAAIEIEPDNSKALFRRGKAYLLLENLDKAHPDLKRAAELAPDDAGIKKELQLWQKKDKAQSQKQKKFFGNLFSNMDKQNKEEQKQEELNKKEEEKQSTNEENTESTPVPEPVSEPVKPTEPKKEEFNWHQDE